MGPMLKNVRISVSQSLRTDVPSLKLVVRLPFSVAQFRDRVAELPSVPPDRLGLVEEKSQRPIQQEDGVPDRVTVQDAWRALPSRYDVMDVIIAGPDPPPSFVLKVDRKWQHALRQVTGGNPASLMKESSLRLDRNLTHSTDHGGR